VTRALRLGWNVAEVRGRNRPGGPLPRSPQLPSRADHELPLRLERTHTELRIEVQKTVIALTEQLGMSGPGARGGVLAKRIDWLAKAQSDALAKLAKATVPADHATLRRRADKAWQLLAETIYRFDALVQDALTGVSDSVACGYQLGRGLSEVYWALEPDPGLGEPAPTSGSRWTFLLGAPRQSEMAKLAGRLSAYLGSYTPAAIDGSLVAWGKVANDMAWRGAPDARDVLYRQARRWYELLVLQQDPSTLVGPYAAIRNFGTLWRIARVYWLQLVFAIGSLVAVVALVIFLQSTQHTSASKGVFTALSVLGVSATTVTTRLKSSAQSMSTRVKQDAYADLLASEITTLPKYPGAWQYSRRAEREVRRSVRQRSITAATPPPA
jgi:hypothetical protein